MTHVNIKHISKYSIQLFYLCAIHERDLQQDCFAYSLNHLFIYYLLNQYLRKATLPKNSLLSPLHSHSSLQVTYNTIYF